MLSKKDQMVLSYFRKDARASLTSLSKKTAIPVSTLFDKLRKFENDIITKHTSMVNFQKLGFDLRVTIALKVNKDEKPKIQSFLVNHERINSVFQINNGYDFLIEGIFTNMRDFQIFNDQLDKFQIHQKNEFYILDELKKEGFMSDPDTVSLI